MASFFIGGNHEPYGYLDSEPSGFELVKNCNYMGRAEMIAFAGLSIAGLSGIYSEHKFNIARPAPSKINKISNKEYIYFNESEVEKLADCKSVDILLLHEWPSDIISIKDEAEFENQRRSMRYDSIGNEYAKMLVDILNPKLVLCGHMHKKYQNSIQLESGSKSDIVCLASIHQGDDVFEVFSSSKNTISRL